MYHIYVDGQIRLICQVRRLYDSDIRARETKTLPRTAALVFTDGKALYSVHSMPLQLRVISHNIRYATSDPSKNERLWPERAPIVLSQLHHELRPVGIPVSAPACSPAIPTLAGFVCLQEALHGQLVDVLVGLNNLAGYYQGSDPPDGPIWAHIGVGRDNGKRKGEYCPILYPVNIFELLHSETVWLSLTPDRPSKGWDAGCIRLLTVGVFEHKGTKQKIVAANTHLDHVGSRSRYESVSIILKTLKRVHAEWSNGGGLGMFLAGDFNSFPTQEAYLEMKKNGYMADAHDEVDAKHRYGDITTFTGFAPDQDKEEQGRIDFLWLGPCDKNPASLIGTPWAVDGYAVLPNVFEAGIYLSDHRAVVGDLRLLH
jgi:endonuclease/exonuclease/phosphatase family metal-dependent hydrolase